MNYSNNKNGVICEESKDSGIISPCHDKMLDSDIFETCIPDFEDYCSLLSRIAIEVNL